MTSLGVYLLLLPFLALADHWSPLPAKTTVTLHKDTKLVLFGTRHGNRNPEAFVKVPGIRTWGMEGELELTSIGKRQAYGLGKEVRTFVSKFINENYVPSEAKFFSSSANRCQMTLQAALAGLYTPNGWGDWNKGKLDNWSPVPYSINDPLLRMYSVKGCTNSDKAWDPISKDTLPDLAELVKKNQELLNYMKEKDGREAKIGNAADIADNIINMDFYNATYPDWLAKPSLPGYDKKKIREAFLAFAENHMNRCASYKPCRNMMGGLWADNIVQALDAVAAGKSSPKLIGYASHTEVTLATMKILGIKKDELTTSAGFVVESQGAKVRLLQHDPNPIDQHVIYKATLESPLDKAADKDGWMKVEDFKKYVKENSFTDWETQCGIPKCTA